MVDYETVWAVDDCKTGRVIGIYATYEEAMRVADENIDRASTPRQLLIDKRLGEKTVVDLSTKGEPIRKDPETGRLEVDPDFIRMINESRAEKGRGDRSRKSWWRFWE